MTNRKAEAANEAASVATLQAQLAEVECELATALAVQDAANQTSIWSFNAMGASDAFIARSEQDKLIKRLEQLSFDAEAVKADADVLVRRLRDRQRELTQKLGSNINSAQTKSEREKAVETAKANAEAIVKSQPAKAQLKATAKQKTKTELIAEAKKQTASKKKAA
jgi:hypothetical protein